MSRTFIRQDTQIRQSDLFDGTLIPGSTLESGSASLEGDLNSLRSTVYNLLKKQTGGNWYDDIATPTNFPTDVPAPAKRAVDNLNSGLRDIERKRVLVANFTDISVTVPAGVAATATFSSTGAFSNNETITIGGQTYTFKAPFVNAANNIDASGTTAQTHENLRRAIKGDGIAGTNYGTGTTVNTFVTATDTASSNVLTAKNTGTAGNLIATTTTCVNATVPATLSGGAGDVAILTLGQIPASPGNIAAIGSVTTLGSVAATATPFGTHSLALVTGGAPISPKNLCDVYDQSTGQAIQSGGRQVYALFQVESSTDGSTMTGTTPNRAQLSFVRINALDTALEAVPGVDVAGKTIDYTNVLRKGLSDLTEQDFLRGTTASVPTGTSVTRQIGYDQQGAVPVEITTNADLDLNSAGIFWKIRDLLNADLFTILEGSGGGTTAMTVGADVDVLNINSILNNVNHALRVDIAGQQINIGVTAGTIDSTGSNDLRLYSSKDLLFDDLHQTGSTWVGTAGVKLSATTAEWTAFKTNFGETSILDAINQAKNPVSSRGGKVYAIVTLATNADTDVGGTGGGANLDVQLPNMSGGSFLTDYDVFLNGNLLRPGSNSGANHDYYPGTSLILGQLKFEFKVKAGGKPDVICVVPYA